MAPNFPHAEKAHLPYYDAESRPFPTVDGRYPQQKKRLLWKRLCALALFSVIAMMFAGRLLENHIAALFTPDRAAINTGCVSQEIQKLDHGDSLSSSDTNSIPTVVGVTSTSSEASLEGGLVTVPQDVAPSEASGVSIAASVDPYVNRFLFDLSSSGVFRLRKSAGGTTSWTQPETVPVYPPPKANSPMASIAWDGTDGGSNTYFTVTAAGGLSALWFNDLYGVWLYYTTSTGAFMVQIWGKGGWQTYSTGLTVYPKTDLSAWKVDDAAGHIWYVLAVNADGALVEYVFDQTRGDKKYSLGKRDFFLHCLSSKFAWVWTASGEWAI
ncbi:MAG: hypothetical protein Q9222_006568 [Ikaeria aurantiellina]